jgi:hypothetical protein
MHTSKNLFLAGAAALCLTTFAVHAKDTDADAQLREAMRSKMSETKPQAAPKAPTAVPAAPAKPVTTTAPANTATKPAVTVTTTKVVTTASPATSTSETDAMREAMRARIAGEAPAAAVTSSSATAAAMPSAQAASLTTLTPPPSPLSATKAQRLQALLEQYKTDQITPEQYHAQRAKIIAE